MRALDNYLPELGYEVARSEDRSTRHDLAQLEAKLTRLLEKLRTGADAWVIT